MASGATARFKRLQEEAKNFLDERRMALMGDKTTRWWRFFAFWVIVGKSFGRNRCPVRASALAYTTLLALIPLLAVGIGVSTSLLKSEDDKPIQDLIDRIVQEVAPQLGLFPDSAAEEEDARREVAHRISQFIANIHSGALGITGTLALIVVAIGLLSTIEATFNDIWGVPRGRNLFARIIQYWAAITLGPLLMVLSMGLAIGGRLEATQQQLLQLPVVGALALKVSAFLVPLLILTATFMLFYQLMPNTRVDWRAALVGGFVGGLLWTLNSQFNVLFAARVVNTSKIYGSLGVVPVFLIGLYFSWLILLFGAQVSYAFQNRRTYLQEKRAEIVNQRGREFIALRLLTTIGVRFQNGQAPPTATEMGEQLEVPRRLVTQILCALVENRLLLEVAGVECGYVPARPLNQINFHDVLYALRAGQGQELATRDEPLRGILREEFDRIRRAEESTAAELSLERLVEEARPISPEPVPANPPAAGCSSRHGALH